MTIPDVLKDVDAVNRALRACERDESWHAAMNEMSSDVNATFVRALDLLVELDKGLRDAAA